MAADQTARLLGETIVTFSEAAKSLPSARGGRHANPATLWRHATKGCKAPDGTVVRLEAVRVGNHWFTSKEAVARFVERLTAAALPGTPIPRTPAERRRAADRAESELTRLGVG